MCKVAKGSGRETARGKKRGREGNLIRVTRCRYYSSMLDQSTKKKSRRGILSPVTSATPLFNANLDAIRMYEYHSQGKQ